MMMLKRPAVAQKCQSLELSIVEAVRTIKTTRAQLESAATQGAHDKMRSTIKFTETRRNALIRERIELEGARLAEIADAMKAANDGVTGAEVATLTAELAQIEKRKDELEILLRRLHGRSDSAYTKIREAEVARDRWSSERPVDAPNRAQLQRELRERLDALA